MSRAVELANELDTFFHVDYKNCDGFHECYRFTEKELEEFYQAAFTAGEESMREKAIMCIPGGTICDPQAVADEIRALKLEGEKE